MTDSYKLVDPTDQTKTFTTYSTDYVDNEITVLNNTITTANNAVLMQVSQEISVVNQAITNLNNTLTAAIDQTALNAKNYTDQQVSDAKGYTDQQIADAKAYTDTSVSNLETTLNTSISNVETSLNTNISNLEATFNGSISAINTSINTINSTVGNVVYNVANIENEIAAVNNKLDAISDGTGDLTLSVLNTDELKANSLDMNNGFIINVANPVTDTGAANKQYVDDAIASVDVSSQLVNYLPKSGGTMTGSLTIPSPYGLSSATGQFTQVHTNTITNADGSGVIDVMNNRLQNTVAPIATNDAANKAYVDSYVPSLWSASNPMVTQDELNNAVFDTTVRQVGADAAGSPFATAAALIAGPYYYRGSTTTPNEHDTAVVLADETAPAPFANGQTVHKYDGATWDFLHGINESPFTAAQNAAIDSGITSTLVSKISTNETNVAANTSAISVNAGKILTNTNNIAALQNTGITADLISQITTNKNNIATNAGNITALQNLGLTSTLVGQITTNKNNIATNASNITALQTGLAGKMPLLNFSTSEQDTGVNWIDGKRIYCITTSAVVPVNIAAGSSNNYAPIYLNVPYNNVLYFDTCSVFLDGTRYMLPRLLLSAEGYVSVLSTIAVTPTGQNTCEVTYRVQNKLTSSYQSSHTVMFTVYYFK